MNNSYVLYKRHFYCFHFFTICVNRLKTWGYVIRLITYIILLGGWFVSFTAVLILITYSAYRYVLRNKDACMDIQTKEDNAYDNSTWNTSTIWTFSLTFSDELLMWTCRRCIQPLHKSFVVLCYLVSIFVCIELNFVSMVTLFSFALHTCIHLHIYFLYRYLMLSMLLM